MSKHKYEILNPELDVYHLTLNEALFYNANGYIGVRYDFEEGYPEGHKYLRSQYINGFYDYSELNQPEKLFGLNNMKQIMLNVADTQGINLYIDGENFSMFTGKLLKSSISLDMDRGVTIRDVLWQSPEGREVHIRITRMASFSRLSLFTIEYEIEPLNFSGEINIQSEHQGKVLNYYDETDPRLGNENIQRLFPESCELLEDTSYITSKTSSSGLKVCSAVKNQLSKPCAMDFYMEDHKVTCSMKISAETGEKITLVKYSVFCDSIRNDNCRERAETEIREAAAVSMEHHYSSQVNYLKTYFDNCFVEIDGQDKLNLELKYDLYQLIQSCGKDKYCNIAPRGLSGDAYEGHYFWDTEIYVQPFFTITNPKLSRNLIEFRYETLNMARENAAIMGHNQGALYPWRTIMGRECSGYYPAGSAQYHINGDIAYSIIAYYLATGDMCLIIDKGAEIILETARLWLDAGNYSNGKFNINDVTGPDEYTCIVNNNYYTNAMARYHMEWAVKIYKMLKSNDDFINMLCRINLSEEEILDFEKAAKLMYLPYDADLGINPQDDSFLQKKKWDLELIPAGKFPLLLHYHPLHLYRHQICKQADTLLAHFLLEDFQTVDTMVNSFNYYEKITTHDSSLSQCIFGIMAARLGMKEKACSYFREFVSLDLQDKQRNTKDGVHIANMAGTFMAVVYGFGGLRLKGSGISFSPMLPEDWSGYKFKACYLGSRFLVTVKKKSLIFEMEQGAPVKIKVYGKEYLLEKRLDINAEKI